MTITLPVPPSANRYWRHAKGRTYRSAAANAYRKLVQTVSGCRVATTPCSVTVVWYRAAKRGDLDNRLKVLFDALQGVAYTNDSLIVEIHAYRREDKSHPRMEVTVEELDPPIEYQDDGVMV